MLLRPNSFPKSGASASFTLWTRGRTKISSPCATRPILCAASGTCLDPLDCGYIAPSVCGSNKPIGAGTRHLRGLLCGSLLFKSFSSAHTSRPPKPSRGLLKFQLPKSRHLTQYRPFPKRIWSIFSLLAKLTIISRFPQRHFRRSHIRLCTCKWSISCACRLRR